MRRADAGKSREEIDALSLSVSCLFRAVSGQLADRDKLEDGIAQVRSGLSFEALAGNLATSPEFVERYGAEDNVDEKYLTALYRDVLGREPDQAGIANFLEAGKNGMSRGQALASFASSEEALAFELAIGRESLLVQALYQTAFGRRADPAGLQGNLKQLQQGTPLEALAEAMTNSEEYRIRNGPSRQVDAEFVNAVYRKAFGRDPGFAEISHWLMEGRNGATQATVVAALIASEEALERVHPINPTAEKTYDHWVRGNDTIGDADRVAIRAHIAALPFRPFISVVLVMDPASEEPLRKSLDSVTAQLYSNWELCAATDPSSEPAWTQTIQERIASRIKTIRLGTTATIADTTNAALAAATNDFVIFLTAGDVLPEHALYEMALELGTDTTVDIVYTDMDQIDGTGRRANPWFKPGWDPDLLLSQDYLNHLILYRLELLERIGFLRPGFDGAEFRDLALRATAATTPDRIRHIPAILYHQSAGKGPLSIHGIPIEDRCVASSNSAVRDHLNRLGYPDAVLTGATIPRSIRVVWPVPEPEPLVSVIIPTRDGADLLERCVEGVLRRSDYSNLEILVVDNGSKKPETIELFDRLTHEDSRVRILSRPGPFNYSALNNAAAREAEGEVLLLLNNDIDVVESHWLREMVSHAIRPDVGIVGAKLLYPTRKIQHAGIVLGPSGGAHHLYCLAKGNDPGYCGQLLLTRTLSAVTGACLAIRRAVFFEIGGLDEVNLKVAFNDIDICLRAGDYGYRIVWTPFAVLIHFESVTRGTDTTPTKQTRFSREHLHLMRNWGSILDSGDPFHNPNLLLTGSHIEIPSVPRRRKPWHFVIDQVPELYRYFPQPHDTFTKTHAE
jgi:GT2 family glycosyltransferase